jgi:DNA-directed RNA polymerase specialized sigma24 family protein
MVCSPSYRPHVGITVCCFFLTSRYVSGAVANDTKDLLERALDDNDHEAWEEHMKQGYKTALGVVKGRHDIDREEFAKEAVSRALEGIVRLINSGQLRKRSRLVFLSYVKAAAFHANVDEFRWHERWGFVPSTTLSKEGEELSTIDGLPNKHPASNPEQTTIDRERLRKCKDTLSEIDKEIVKLYYMRIRG